MGRPLRLLCAHIGDNKLNISVVILADGRNDLLHVVIDLREGALDARLHKLNTGFDVVTGLPK